MRRSPRPLLPLLRGEVDALDGLRPSYWDVTVRQARAAGLLARLCVRLDADDRLQQVPERPRQHLLAARILAQRHAEQTRWEVGRINEALAAVGIPAVLLKGAAYLMAGLPAAQGRVFSDIDILVPHGALGDSERALRLRGWVGLDADPYDQRYYRQWMHELPPLRHALRQTVIDVHHTILPPTARLKPDAGRLLADALPLDGCDDLYVPCPADLVLHSATHLFHEGEFGHGLRDLVDLDDLTRHFWALDGRFWTTLLERAREMDLRGPLHYGLRYAQRFLDTPVPAEVSATLRAAGPGLFARPLMDALFDRALAPQHRSCDDFATPGARWLLYVRSHYLRMPLRLLLPHLARKAWKRQFPDEKDIPGKA